MRSLLAATCCASAAALSVGTPARTASPRVAVSPVMMPKFLKQLFPDLEKPEDAMAAISGAFSGLFATKEEPVTIDVKPPSEAITLAGKGMPVLAPIFNAEAVLQAFVTNLGGYDEEEVQADIASTSTSAPVVIYTYSLSPFSTEAIAVLESTGCDYKNVELGLEWFALGPKGSATRVEMRKLYGQGSLPHIFIGGEWVGGLTTGADGGLTGLVEREELVGKLKKARAI